LGKLRTLSAAAILLTSTNIAGLGSAELIPNFTQIPEPEFNAEGRGLQITDETGRPEGQIVWNNTFIVNK
jgi:hypothetical protein